jgi:secondary thiamine-phosphate synthase enzyme
MKSSREIITMNTQEKKQIVNITQLVQKVVGVSGIQEGLALVYPMHTSSTVYISDSDWSLTEDFDDVLEKLVPALAGYRHDETDYKKNADGHLKAILTGHHIVLPVTEGRLDLGTYQTIYYFEFDGGREKEVLVKIIGE